MENVEVSRKRFGHFPRTFEWQGKKYEISSVDKCWTSPELEAGPVERYYFFVESDGEFYTLYQEATDGSWHVLT